MVDGISEDGFKIALNPAYELSFLKIDEQNDLVQCIQDTLATPSLAQAQELKRLSQKNELDEDKIVDMLMDVKPNQKKNSVSRWRKSTNTFQNLIHRCKRKILS